MMKVNLLTIFPKMVEAVLSESIARRARDKGLLEVAVTDLRSFATDRHRTVDDAPYGGGPGMVLKPEPIFAAVDRIRAESPRLRVILTSPQGRRFDDGMARELSQESCPIVFICGHYEGVDERVRAGLGAEEVSIGDYILTGGELAALVMIDASLRLIPGVLGEPGSLEEESFSGPRLDFPQYTRPFQFRGMEVPKVLVSGNHEEIRKWRREQALAKTKAVRPDLLRDSAHPAEDRSSVAWREGERDE